MHAVRKGQIRWIGKADAVGREFIHTIFRKIAASVLGDEEIVR
jgi:hypothetical protein